MNNFFKNLTQKTGYIFRLDDIAPNMKWQMMSRVKNLFNNYNIKPNTRCYSIRHTIIHNMILMKTLIVNDTK